ncbi:PadR family transcriptional regulator [Bifidobacterium tibiigranuli]|uniref:PadR family transcriptional regulator n=1 Tax=Bifidobacterium tibiigranuli TaxID=2172043 RepID=UPI00235723E1|nr:PadR family transcriptional regulator [Bifidobacterium tibiigranuli]MCI1210602.1 PadR family transcriptional regulator [Bifidobacterium tibiigranuli]MCI1221926.1 PadR family transcriptional regulator [Bifidobacterium tibiigranuli]MCI1232984.1 PadR family transcriptional regulator [Bifidobacterium tibiigranuli]
MFDANKSAHRTADAACWPALWIRAAMRTAILQTVEHEPLHGYGIALALEADGFGRPKGGSLYPILDELTEGGWLTSQWEEASSGPGRKVYALTDAGQSRLRGEREQWNALAVALHAAPAAEKAPETARKDQASWLAAINH